MAENEYKGWKWIIQTSSAVYIYKKSVQIYIQKFYDDLKIVFDFPSLSECQRVVSRTQNPAFF